MDRFEYTKKRKLEGASIRQISRELGVDHSTVLYWIKNDFTSGKLPERITSIEEIRSDCQQKSAAYSYILGCYLGDGHISQLARTQRLRIFSGTAHPSIIEDQIKTLRVLFDNVVSAGKSKTSNMQIISVHNNHLDKYFPQHGLGKKHDRDVSLSPWQRDIVSKAPEPFIKGLIDTDGSNYIRVYEGVEYECYSFTNKSVDIINMYEDVMGQLGIKCKQTTRKDGVIRIFTQKRSDVQRINEIYDIADKKLSC